MSERERLQKAIETTMAAGYQIDREAFELLTAISATEDPNNVINKAILKMDELEEKPMFICKSFLEELLKSPESEPAPAVIEAIEPQAQEPTTQWQPEGAITYHPYA